jgi:uncharacterized OB-fold protein
MVDDSTSPSGLPTHDPVVGSETAPYWQGLVDGEIRLPWCRSCDGPIWYPRAQCPLCGDADLDWRTISPLGTVYSYSVVRKTPGRWNEHVPFVLAYVELDAGPRVMTNIVTADPEGVHCGQQVTAMFDPTPGGMAQLRFRPV